MLRPPELVQAVQLPEDEPVALADEAFHWGSEFLGVGGALSAEFRLLLHRLVEQHVQELQSERADRAERASERRAAERAERETAERAEREGHCEKSAQLGSDEKKAFAMASRSGSRNSKTSAFAGALTKQHEALPAVHASQILDVWESKDTGMIDEWDAALKNRSWAEFVQSTSYEFIMAGILSLNVLWMAFELQLYGSWSGDALVAKPPEVDSEFWAACFMTGDLIFTILFGIDVTVRICVLKTAFFRSPLNYIDITVTFTSVLEVVVYYTVRLPLNSAFFRLLRIGKLARAIRMLTMTSALASLQLLVKCLAASRDMLFWSFLLLALVQGVACLVVSTLCRDYVDNPALDVKLREEVYQYYGTFTRSFLTMFEVLFANWGPPCRILVENVSEWFSVFFLLYRCVLGFAVLNVVNAVFVQQTMKTASSDEELAFKQKQKDMATYTRKVKRLFQTIDISGDGAINLEEFAKLVSSPKLQFWMGQLELEYHDLLSLFEFLDNGDGEITLMEFIDGAVRLRGNAKALDVWRMETKLEVLFQEVLTALDPKTMRQASTRVQDVFNHSSFKHIKCTTHAMRNAVADEMEFCSTETG
ncbi:unnamed protein product [Effrenium voratum]|uniref:EF-hand domain-containing protein n=1 Tax=Effrenium voratum TaxID=2562239 RepID=A0AA36ILE7_9DINO|nr:unnamed protein product [Effrenium voratum]